MEQIYRYIIEESAQNHIEKETAVQLIKTLKQQDGKTTEEDIAVTGIALELPQAHNKEQFWNNLVMGKDCISNLPEGQRKTDVEKLYQIMERPRKWEAKCGFLDEIDKFDYPFFKLSFTEARTMNPEQRMFLQTAWHALEDAGYTKERLSTEKVGTYVGYSTDFGEEYKNYAQVLNPQAGKMVSVSNIKSMIASRISYLLDLHGPSMLIDTACSSSLMAVHLACQSIHAGECDTALAGGVKLNLLATKTNEENKIGIEASDGKTRTFDDNGDGTGFGEGVMAVVLKPLKRARKDGDNIYAVIKGSAANQDGTSIGITAPNAVAQKEVLLEAWKNAKIDPETLSYIEVHGTGTKLGDPIELDGLEMAFREYTEKKQFCAAGSVKSNIGHLDHCAGVAGFIKAVLALQHKVIPPTLHFQRPNRKVEFEDSAVYVNDKPKSWDCEMGRRRCGVSSFGISGTNCHVVLEEYPKQEEPVDVIENQTYLITLSGKTKESLMERIHMLYQALFEYQGSMLNLSYSLNARREHYDNRIAMICTSKEDLQRQLMEYRKHDLDYIPAWEMSQRVESTQEFGKKQYYEELGKKYLSGSLIDWNEVYKEYKCQNVSLPGYPFERLRCWLPLDEFQKEQETMGPLVEELTCETSDRNIYQTHFRTAQYWVLKEHLVNDVPVLPGTVYVEMLEQVLQQYTAPSQMAVLKELVFLEPFTCEGEERVLQLVLKKENGWSSFQFVSKKEETWKTHATGKIEFTEKRESRTLDLNIMIQECDAVVEIEENRQVRRIQTSDRWDCLRKIYRKGQKALGFYELKNAYQKESKEYLLHPAMFDCCVNMAIESLEKDVLYLPFSYGRLELFGKMPDQVYTLVESKTDGIQDIVRFDLTLCDTSGKVFATIKDYSLKARRVALSENHVLGKDMFFTTEWRAFAEPVRKVDTEAEFLLIRDRESKVADRVEAELALLGQKTTGLLVREDWNEQKVLREIQEKNFQKIIFLTPELPEFSEITVSEQFDKITANTAGCLFWLAKALTEAKKDRNTELIVIGKNGYQISGEEEMNPFTDALFGLTKAIGTENPGMVCRCIEIANEDDLGKAVEEAVYGATVLTVAYRNNQRYVQYLKMEQPDTVSEVEIVSRENGNYVITGGTGGIGLELACYFATGKKANVFLISRSGEVDLRDPVKKKAYQKLKQLAGKVECRKGDVCNELELAYVLETIRMECGKIDGIIHLAGIPDEGFICNKSYEAYRKVAEPKMKGAWNLERLTAQDNLDFFCLFSSFVSLTGAPGQSAYTMANSFLNGFSRYCNLQGKKTMVMLWPIWQETGMAVKFHSNHMATLFEPVTSKDAIACFAKALKSGKKETIIGKIQKHAREFLETVQVPFGFSEEIMEQLKKQDGKERVEQAKLEQPTPVQDGLTVTENTIYQCWKNVLGNQNIQINQNFNEVGGNSIIASYLLNEINRYYPDVIGIADIFTYPTIQLLSEYIDRITGKGESEVEAPQDELDEIMEMLSSGKMSVTKAVEMLQTEDEE